MTDANFRFVVPSTGERLDRLVADATGCGRRMAKRWLQAGSVRVNGHVASGADVPAAGSEVVVEQSASPSSPPPLGLDVVLEEEHYLVVAKPAGLHCERGKSSGSVAELLEARYGDLSWIGERAEEAGLVHRIDRDTSGAVVVARDRATYRRLREAFRSGDTRKQYLALAGGRLEQATGIDLPLCRRATRMAPARNDRDGLPACTRVEPLEIGSDWTLVLATMSTGAMHQVRAHLSALGHPLLGDALYGGTALPGARDGQLLHASRVQVGYEIDVTVGVPCDFAQAYARLKRRDETAR